MNLTADARVRRRGEALSTRIGEETVMLDVDKGLYYGLDPVASRIWDLLESPQRVADLCARLTDEFEVDAKTCSEDVLRFLEELQRSDLLEIDGA